MTNDANANFLCNVCSHSRVSRILMRGDGKRVLFCENCGMGIIESPPTDTSTFYEDGYYGSESGGELGYSDYAYTAEHSLLWVKFLIEALVTGGRVLDVGCADGFLLRKLGSNFERYGIEMNSQAATRAREYGVQIIASDVLTDAFKQNFRNSFDIITSIATFEHVLDLRSAFSACVDALKPDGALIFEVPLISEVRDNKDWLHGSYEHIYYPTVQSVEALLSNTGDLFHLGFESEIEGYSSTYIGAVTRSAMTFSKLEHLFKIMRQNNLNDLNNDEIILNLSYNVIHSFQSTPERVLALPLLLQNAYSTSLINRLIQLWHSDCTAAESAQWHKTQARNWENVYRESVETTQWHRTQAKNWENAFEELKKSITQKPAE